MDDDVDISLGSEEIDAFVDLWEAHRCLWDPADRDYNNRGGGARGTAMTSIAETFGGGWTTESSEVFFFFSLVLWMPRRRGNDCLRLLLGWCFVL